MRSDFCSFLLGFGKILVRFLVKNGQIVGQIFPNFGQIIILTTLVLEKVNWEFGGLGFGGLGV